MTQPTRRTVLRRGGAGLAGVMAASAGCLDTLPFLGEEFPAYTDWLYAPSELTSNDRYPVYTADAEAMGDIDAGSFTQSIKDLKETFDGVESIRTLIGAGTGYVIQGEYTSSDVISSLTEQGLEEQETYNGYTLLSQSLGSGAIGVAPAAIVFASPEQGETPGQEVVRAIIDAKQEEINRYTEENEAFATLSTHLTGDVNWAGGASEGGDTPLSSSELSSLVQIGGGTITLEEKNSQLTGVFVLKDGSSNVSDVKEKVRADAPDAAKGVSFSEEDDVLLAEMTIPTKELQE